MTKSDTWKAMSWPVLSDRTCANCFYSNQVNIMHECSFCRDRHPYNQASRAEKIEMITIPFSSHSKSFWKPNE